MQDELDALEKAISNLETDQCIKATEHVDLYKNWGRLKNQEERRRELLEIQKSNRSTNVDSFRGILNLVNTEEKRDIFNKENRVCYRPNIYVAGFHKTKLSYDNVLMLSEWMIEKPENFSEEWYMAPCPKGLRMLVVANGGTTKFYSKFGRYKFEYYTALPGGSPLSRSTCCVLDCFYYEVNKTVYVLDVLAWKNQPMTDGETEFRQYWLKCQFDDLGPRLQTTSRWNNIVFKLLPMVPCTKDMLNNALSIYPFFEDNSPPIDGLLFYHKNAHYFAGETPLVGWLFPYMVPEIIDADIKLHPSYAVDKPKGYTNQTDFIEKFEAAMLQKKKKHKSADNALEMEISKKQKIHENDMPANVHVVVEDKMDDDIEHIETCIKMEEMVTS